MSAFLSELADQVADKWVTLVVAPGLIFLVAALGGGHFIGQRHWADWTLLYRRVTALSTSKSLHSQVVITVLAAAILAGSAAAGLAARGLGDLTGRLWMGRWPRVMKPLSRRLTDWRRKRWNAANQAHQAAMVTAARIRVLRMQGRTVAEAEPDLAALKAARNAIGLVEPKRPTWIGDRLLAADSRIFKAYDIDLNFAWARLWMTLTDTGRSDLTAARGGFDGASRLVGWGLLYLGLGCWWWPSALIGVALIVTGTVRGRETGGSYAELIEAAVDVHGRDLATALGFAATGALTVTLGDEITQVVRKGA